MTNSHTSRGYGINSKGSARRIVCRAVSPSPSPPYQQDEAIKCSRLHVPQVVKPPKQDHSCSGSERAGAALTSDVRPERIASASSCSEEQPQRHMYRWRNQQLMQGERPRAAVAPVCGTLPGTLVDPNKGPPPANVGDENSPGSRRYDHLIVPYGIYCTLVALASLSFSIVIIFDIIYVKKSAYMNFSLSSWASDICYLAIILLTGCVAMLLPVAILIAKRGENNGTLPILWNQDCCEGCKMCCTTQIGSLKVAVPVLCLVNFFFHGVLYLPMQGGPGWWFAGMIVWLALAISGFVFLCCVARNDSR